MPPDARRQLVEQAGAGWLERLRHPSMGALAAQTADALRQGVRDQGVNEAEAPRGRPRLARPMHLFN